MTKFKQGEMPGSEQAYKLIKEATDTLMNLRIKAEKSSVNETELYVVQMKLFQAMDNLSLRPASPKWEPKVGENAIFRDRQVIIHAINDIHVWISYDGTGPFTELLSSLRPIAPSPEEEIRDIIENVTSDKGDDIDSAVNLIMAIFNRHKEGGQNDND